MTDDPARTTALTDEAARRQHWLIEGAPALADELARLPFLPETGGDAHLNVIIPTLRALVDALDRATRDLAAAQAAARQYFAALAEYAMWVDVSPPLPDTTRESREEARRRLQQAELTLRAASLPADAGAVGEGI